MTLVNDFSAGSLYSEEHFTKEEILEKMKKDVRNQLFTTFRVLGKGINVSIHNKGETFSVSVLKEDNPSASTMIDTYRKVEDKEKLAELIADYAVEKLEDFQKDDDYSLRIYLDNTPRATKDLLLYKMISEKQKEKTFHA